MITAIKRILKIVWLSFVAVTAVFFAAILSIQLPQVQTYLVKKVTESLEGKIDGRIVFDKIHLRPFNALVLKNVAVIDDNPLAEGADTLFKAEYIIGRFSLNGLMGNDGLRIGRAYISNAEMTLVIEGDRIVNLTRIFRIPLPDPDKPKNDKPVFKIRRASISDMTFRLKNVWNPYGLYAGYGIDWDNLEVNDINIEARRLDLTGNVMTGTLDFMSFCEKSGYVCNSLSGKARVGDGKSIIEDIRLSDPWSEIDVPLYSMSYDDPRHFSDFIGKIRLEGNVATSSVDMKTISYFAPGLKDVRMKSELSGKVSGVVKDMIFKDMNIRTSDGVRMMFDGRMTGLPDIGKTYFDLDLKEMVTTTSGLEASIRSFAPGSEVNIADMAEGVEFSIRADVSGKLDDLDARVRAVADTGSLAASVNIRNLVSGKGSVRIAGDMASEDFNLGHIVDSRLLGPCSMRAKFNADLGSKGEGPQLGIDSLFVDRLHFNGYDYSSIAAAGTMERNAFDGRIICNDPNLNFMFQGVFSLSARTRNSVYKFYANIGYADLNALNIDKRGMSEIRLQATANFNRKQRGDLFGNMKIEDIVLRNNAGRYDIGDIAINSYFGDELYRMRLGSSFADASFDGSAQITKFLSDLNEVTLKRELPALFRDTVHVRTNDRYRIAFRCKNSMDLMAFVAPGMYISDSTSLDMRIDTAGVFRASLSSPRIAYNENNMKNVEMKLDNVNGSLTGELRGKTMNIATVTLENNSLKLFAKNDFIGFGYTYENPGELVNKGEIFITNDIHRDENDNLCCHIKMLPSRVLLNSREWAVKPSFLMINGGDVDVDMVEFSSGDQAIKISGGYSKEKSDTLTMRLERFDISMLNPLLKNRFGIEGAVTGEARLAPQEHGLGLTLQFMSDSTRIAGAEIGTLRLASRWDDLDSSFKILAANELAGHRTFGITGSYFPASKKIQASADLLGTDISYAQPFLQTVFSSMEGSLSGKISVEGSSGDYSISSEGMRLDRSKLTIAFTNVPYNVFGDFHIDDSGVQFDDMLLNDRNGNTGRITGGISYDRLKDIRLDAGISVTDMECLNTTEEDNSSFYGNLSATGELAITGPLNAITLDVNAMTSGTGQIHIPIPSSATATTGDLLSFRKPETEVYVDPYEQMIRKIRTGKKESSELGVRLDVQVTPEIEAFVEIDKSTGNVLRGRGAGNIELELHGDEFNILGDYTLTSGNYRFVAQELAYRDFTISDGSSIKFNGDIMDSDLDINATYRTKTSLATLIADTSSVSTRRTVDCGINISDKVRSPRLAFSIDIPDIDPTIKSRVESALSTEDKVQKQFISLILFNSFLPDDQSGIVNNSMLFSTVTDIMYNQLNNIFQKLDIPLDLGLSYQPNERGQDIFDVAISTQLFNNRVVVNGNLGNRQYSSVNSNSDVVGDLDIEIKLDKAGLFRLNIFSHSADQYTNYLDDSQRNGIGIAYQQEFNTFREFFSNLFSRKKKKNAQADNGAMAEARQEKKTIIIRPNNE